MVRNLPLDMKYMILSGKDGKTKTVLVPRDPSAYPRWMKRKLKRERKNK